MIIPLVQEHEWLNRLERLPAWELPANSVVVVCPHPDDETLGAGGLIASMISRGMKVQVIAVTNGEAAYPDENSQAVNPDSALGRQRTLEHGCALSELGVRRNMVVRLNLPDSDVASHEELLTEKIRSMLSGSETFLLAPWIGDFHPDHEACGRAALEAARSVGAPVSFYVFWTWHRGTEKDLENLSLKKFPLDEPLMAARCRALHCHQSQLRRDDGNPILPDFLLAPMTRPFEVFIDA